MVEFRGCRQSKRNIVHFKMPTSYDAQMPTSNNKHTYATKKISLSLAVENYIFVKCQT